MLPEPGVDLDEGLERDDDLESEVFKRFVANETGPAEGVQRRVEELVRREAPLLDAAAVPKSW